MFICNECLSYLKHALQGKNPKLHGHYGGFVNMPPVIRTFDSEGKEKDSFLLGLKPGNKVFADAANPMFSPQGVPPEEK